MQSALDVVDKGEPRMGAGRGDPVFPLYIKAGVPLCIQSAARRQRGSHENLVPSPAVGLLASDCFL